MLEMINFIAHFKKLTLQMDSILFKMEKKTEELNEEERIIIAKVMDQLLKDKLNP